MFYLYVCVRERAVCVCACQATLYASQFFKNDCFKTFTLSALSMLLVGGGWKCNNDDVQSFVCLNVHCEKVERAPHCQSPLSHCTECSLVFA